MFKNYYFISYNCFFTCCSIKTAVLFLMLLLGTFPSTTSPIETSPTVNFPNSNFRNSNFPNCQLPQKQLPQLSTSPTATSPSSKINHFPNVKNSSQYSRSARPPNRSWSQCLAPLACPYHNARPLSLS